MPDLISLRLSFLIDANRWRFVISVKRYYRPSPHDHVDKRDERGADRRDGRRRTPPEPTDDERHRRTVFVQQPAARLRIKELMSFFEQVGPLKEAQMSRGTLAVRV